ncbi:MAG: hypothetical protein ACI86H_002044 [bacterium]|jgi:hypothetical protein
MNLISVTRVSYFIKISFLILLISFFYSLSFAGKRNVFFRDDFKKLNHWRDFTFQGKKKTKYYISKKKGRSLLFAESNNTASGIVLKKEFNVYNFPIIRWRWKISNIYKKGNAKKRDQSDFPLAIYVAFKYDSSYATWDEKAIYATAKTFFGEYPPYKGLGYVWANKKHKEQFITASSTDRARLIFLQKGKKNIGKWMEEKIHIIRDYEKTFGSRPVTKATIIIMSDSDDTMEKASSYLDYIEIAEE